MTLSRCNPGSVRDRRETKHSRENVADLLVRLALPRQAPGEWPAIAASRPRMPTLRLVEQSDGAPLPAFGAMVAGSGPRSSETPNTSRIPDSRKVFRAPQYDRSRRRDSASWRLHLRHRGRFGSGRDQPPARTRGWDDSDGVTRSGQLCGCHFGATWNMTFTRWECALVAMSTDRPGALGATSTASSWPSVAQTSVTTATTDGSEKWT